MESFSVHTIESAPDASRRALQGLNQREEILSYPGVPKSWRASNRTEPLLPVVPVSFRKGDRAFNFFSIVTTLGTPQDITVQEIRIECFFPADAETERAARDLV